MCNREEGSMTKILSPIVDYLNTNNQYDEEVRLSYAKLTQICGTHIKQNSFIGFALIPFHQSAEWSFSKALKKEAVFRKKYKTYEEKIVAFVDILGFKQLIESTKTLPERLKSIIDQIQYLKAWDSKGPNKWSSQSLFSQDDLVKNALATEQEKYDIQDIVTCTSISDCIIVSVPYDDTNFHQHLSALVSELSYIGAKLLLAGVPIRGGITVGKIIHAKSNLLLGPAYVEAYQLEEKEAIYPRIILSDEIQNRILPPNENTPTYPYQKLFTFYQDKGKNKKNIVGFDQLQYFKLYANNQYNFVFPQEINRIKDFIEEQIDSNRNDAHILEKYLFMKNRFNRLNIPIVSQNPINPSIMNNLMDEKY